VRDFQLSTSKANGEESKFGDVIDISTFVPTDWVFK
jgi:hypothetical protein